jgi:hypothetical protein
LGSEITIRQFADDDAPHVRELFIVVNWLLSPPDLRAAFEVYIEQALVEEIDRIPAYYGEKDGGFGWASEATRCSARLAWNAPRLTQWSCGACMSIHQPDDRGSLGECSNMRKMNAAVETSHGLGLVRLKYKLPLWPFTGTPDTSWYAQKPLLC